MNGLDGFSFDELDCLSQVYVLEKTHYELLKENFRIKHMEAMNESYDIITEAVADMFTKMGEFFKKMIDAIKEFFKKLFMYIASYFMDIDKFVKTYKKQLDDIKEVDFTISGYKFTLDKKPDLSEFNTIIESYNTGLDELSKMKKDDILKQQRDYMQTAHLNSLRAKVLGTDSVNTDEDNYTEIVRKFYRDGEDDVVDIEVDMTRFKQAISDAEKLSKEKKEAEKLRDKSILMFNKAENFFSKSANVMYHNGQTEVASDKVSVDMTKNEFKVSDSSNRKYTSSGKMDVINTFIRFKYNQTHELSIMSNIVVREYANAYKDAVKQTREIIRRALTKPVDKKEDKND